MACGLARRAWCGVIGATTAPRQLRLSKTTLLLPAALAQRTSAIAMWATPAAGRLMATIGGVGGGSSLDCGGALCHAECEGRHLDDVERTRSDPVSGFRSPARPSVVVAASRDMGRTASTWVFNAVRLLYRQARESCDSYWLRRLEPGKVQERLKTGAHLLIKTHEWTDQMSRQEFEAVRPMFTHVVVSVREGFPVDPDWMRVATHVIRFEDIVAKEGNKSGTGAVAVLRALAQHLGIEGLSEDDLHTVDYELMTLPMPSVGCDPVTKHWHFHKRRGGRPQPHVPSGSGQ
mmetsp:Transcript_116041/g.335113  ORF Transcript_116041/g.335113 Transcript_116041/m.335113 type:complete len:290 (+) Transcript_116041:46-915(+)